MAIAGGAVLPLIMGRVLDLGHVRLGFLVPLAALVYLLVHALASGPVTQEA